MASATSDELLIQYHFEFADGRSWQYRIDPASAPEEPEQALPEWTRLGFRQCEHCPLSETDSAHCPFAVALVKPVEVLAQMPSYEEVQVRGFMARTGYPPAHLVAAGLRLVARRPGSDLWLSAYPPAEGHGLVSLAVQWFG